MDQSSNSLSSDQEDSPHDISEGQELLNKLNDIVDSDLEHDNSHDAAAEKKAVTKTKRDGTLRKGDPKDNKKVEKAQKKDDQYMSQSDTEPEKYPNVRNKRQRKKDERINQILSQNPPIAALLPKDDRCEQCVKGDYRCIVSIVNDSRPKVKCLSCGTDKVCSLVHQQGPVGKSWVQAAVKYLELKENTQEDDGISHLIRELKLIQEGI